MKLALSDSAADLHLHHVQQMKLHLNGVEDRNSSRANSTRDTARSAAAPFYDACTEHYADGEQLRINRRIVCI